MKRTLLTIEKCDYRYMILGIVCALLLVVTVAARAKAEQSAWVTVSQNGRMVYESDGYFGPEDFFSHYDDIFDDLDEPFDRIKELTNTPEEFKTVIENKNGGTTTVEHSTNNGETKTVVEANHNDDNSNSNPHPSPTVSASPDGIEINNGHGTCVKKDGNSTTVEAPNVKVHISGSNDSDDNDIDIDSRVDIRRDDNREKTSCDYNSSFDD